MWRILSISGAVAALACGSIADKQACSASTDCPVGQYCAHAEGESRCWADAVRPVVGTVTAACAATPCLRDGVLHVEAAAGELGQLPCSHRLGAARKIEDGGSLTTAIDLALNAGLTGVYGSALSSQDKMDILDAGLAYGTVTANAEPGCSLIISSSSAMDAIDDAAIETILGSAGPLRQQRGLVAHRLGSEIACVIPHERRPS